LRYRQIIGDETFKLRIKENPTFEERITGEFCQNLEGYKVPQNLQTWRAVVQAWNDVKKSEFIKNCFRHVQILNDNQKKQLCETKAIDPCVLDDLIDNQERNYTKTLLSPDQDAEENALDVPCQFLACTPGAVLVQLKKCTKERWHGSISKRDKRKR
ncbi:hypothetical protein BGZ65_010280, partial [Modicella reniformis]